MHTAPAPVDSWNPVLAARKLLDGTLQNTGALFAPWFEHGLEQITAAPTAPGDALFEDLLRRLQIRYACSAEDCARIPASGALVVVANHPFGLAEGPVSWAVLSRVRTDIKFMANSLLSGFAPLKDYMIPVDPFGGAGAVRENWKALREAVEWLRAGHVLSIFPAGEVASLHWRQPYIADAGWRDTVARLIRLGNARALPIFFHGTNSAAFHLAGLVHPRLRTILLPHELLNKAGRTIQVSIGSPIKAGRWSSGQLPSEITGYLRARTMLLGERTSAQRSVRLPVRHALIGAPEDPARLATEVAQLAPDRRLAHSKELHVYLFRGRELPRILREIGRLREITFRGVGEGTGRTIDLDLFDDSYYHLFLWNAATREVAGAYRFASTKEATAERGVRGLYTSTLFRFAPGFLTAISPALELGRSFVRAEYQKSYQPLLLLWKGIGQFIGANPQYRFLFGPVSISQSYSPPSKALMVSFFTARYRNQELAAYVRPRHVYRARALRELDPRNLSSLAKDVGELSEMIADLEPDRKTVPILLQHYLNLGGQILEFSVDGNFSNTLDGLIVVDLLQTPSRLLERHLGKDAAARVRSFHTVAQASACGARV